jgi:branched-subunit amino acid aminotransferase/4-amino-4-deoxychorismate lyase
MSVAADAGFLVREEPVALPQLFEADEVVLTSSLREVYPVRSIDGREVARCGAAEKLRTAFHAAVVATLS